MFYKYNMIIVIYICLSDRIYSRFIVDSVIICCCCVILVISILLISINIFINFSMMIKYMICILILCI